MMSLFCVFLYYTSDAAQAYRLARDTATPLGKCVWRLPPKYIIPTLLHDVLIDD